MAVKNFKLFKITGFHVRFADSKFSRVHNGSDVSDPNFRITDKLGNVLPTVFDPLLFSAFNRFSDDPGRISDPGPSHGSLIPVDNEDKHLLHHVACILFVLTVFTQIKALFRLEYFANIQNSENAAAYGPVVSFSDHSGRNREFDQLDFD